MKHHTWIVIMVKDDHPTGIMTDPKKWQGDYIGNATFDGLRKETKREDLVGRTKHHMMPRQTAQNFAKALNAINKAESTLNKDKNLAKITFEILNIKAVEPERIKRKYTKRTGNELKRTKPPVRILKVYYEKCNDASGPYRWWQDNWFNDQFDVIDEEELKKRIDGAKLFGIIVTEGLPD